MALTTAEITDTKRYCGYPPLAASLANETLEEQAGSAAFDAIIATITPEMEAVVRSIYLVNLRPLESALINAGIGDTDSLDTAKAAVWTRNPSELLERTALFTAERYRLCYDLGVSPGPGIITPLIGMPGGFAGLVPGVMVV